MRVIVQDRQTGRFYAGPSVWVEEPKHALDFGQGVRAVQFCLTHPEHDLHLVYDFENEEMNFSVEARDGRDAKRSDDTANSESPDRP